jgi:hypothetical protein
MVLSEGKTWGFLMGDPLLLLLACQPASVSFPFGPERVALAKQKGNEGPAYTQASAHSLSTRLIPEIVAGLKYQSLTCQPKL